MPLRRLSIIFVYLACAAPLALAETDVERLGTPEGQVDYLWQRRQADAAGDTTTLPLSRLTQTAGAIGPPMNAANAVFAEAAPRSWTMRAPNRELETSLRRVREQLARDLARLPLRQFTNPRDDWQRLRALENSRPLQEAWLRLAPILYTEFYRGDLKEPLPAAGAPALLEQACLPANITRNQILHIDYVAEKLGPQFAELDGAPNLAEAWKGRDYWEKVYGLGDRPNAQSLLQLQELLPGQIPTTLDRQATRLVARAAEYAMVKGARLYLVRNGANGAPSAWVLVAPVESRRNGARANRLMVVDARAIDGKALTPNLGKDVLAMVAAAQGSSNRLLISEALSRSWRLGEGAAPVYAELPRGWLSMDRLRQSDTKNPYTEETLSRAREIAIPKVEGWISGDARNEQAPLPRANDEDRAHMKALAIEGGMQLAANKLEVLSNALQKAEFARADRGRWAAKAERPRSSRSRRAASASPPPAAAAPLPPPAPVGAVVPPPAAPLVAPGGIEAHAESPAEPSEPAPAPNRGRNGNRSRAANNNNAACNFSTLIISAAVATLALKSLKRADTPNAAAQLAKDEQIPESIAREIVKRADRKKRSAAGYWRDLTPDELNSILRSAGGANEKDQTLKRYRERKGSRPFDP